MADQETKNPFEFEVLLKRMGNQINDEQMGKLLHWREKEIACQSEWERFKLNKNEANAERNKKVISEFLNSKTETIAVLAQLYFSIPDPANAVNLFDSGKERERLTKLREDVIKIQSIVSAEFSTTIINDNVISCFLGKAPSSDAPEPDTSNTNSNSIDEGRSFNIWEFADSMRGLQQSNTTETQVDNSTERWISTLNNNQDGVDEL